MRGPRGLLVLAVALLFGCADFKTLEELELAAIESGDWSAVEQRERAIQRREARRGPSCGHDAIAVCERRGGDTRCHCASQDSVTRALQGF